jgi:hypothetical protein
MDNVLRAEQTLMNAAAVNDATISPGLVPGTDDD